MPGYTVAQNKTSQPEAVLTMGQMRQLAAAGGGGAAGPSVVVHVHGTVVGTQSVARAVQTALNQKTLRNGSTQAFIQGRLH
jgi:hypothetical protein